MKNEQEAQRLYYTNTAADYDKLHVLDNHDEEHMFSLLFLSSVLEKYKVRSILDIGSGTGRALLFLKQKYPELKIIGVEPVDALREQGYKNGLKEDELVAGDGSALGYDDESFDIVCAFGVLHHVRSPENVVSEMLRVAKTGIFISDSNNFGSGSALSRFLKQSLDKLGLWKLFNFVITKGKVYHYSAEDGIFYSYSLFNNYDLIAKKCPKIHMINTRNSSRNFYQSATHIALLALKHMYAINLFLLEEPFLEEAI